MINWKKYPKKKILGTGDSIIVSRPDGTTINFDSPISVDNSGNATFSGNVTIQGDLSILNSASQTISFGDNDKLYFGDGNDLEIYHDTSNSHIKNNTGRLQIFNFANNEDILIQGNDGGSAITALTLDMSDAGTAIFNHDIKLADNGRIKLGDAGNDLEISHSGTNSFIENNTGDLNIIQHVDNRDIKFQADDGSGGDTAYLTLDGSATELVASKNLRFDQDNSQIFFAGNNTFVGELSNSGKLQLRGGGSNTAATVYIDSSGNMGLGTSAPTKKLDVRTNGTGNGFRLATSSNNAFAEIINGNSESFPYGKINMNYGATTPVSITALSNEMQLSGGYTTGGKIVFRTATTERMRLTDTGLGIGTTSPSEELHVVGDALVEGTLQVNSNGYGLKLQSEDGTDYIRMRADGSDAFIDAHGQNFLILDGAGMGVKVLGQTSGVVRLVLGSDAQSIRTGNGEIQFWTGSTERLKIDSSGNFYPDVDSACDLGHSSKYFANAYIDAITTTGNVIVGGDLTVSGTTVTVDTTNLNVQDKNITLNYSTGDSSSTADGAGITIQDAVNSSTDATILWDATNDEFDFSHGASFADDVKVAALKRLYFDGGGDTFVVENAPNNLQFKVGGNQKLVLGNSSSTIDSHLKFSDNYQLQLGTDADMQFFHTGGHLYMYNATGDMTFRNNADNADIIFQSDDGSGGIATYFKLDGSSASSGTLYTQFPDNSNLTFGSADDLQIKHDGTDSKITNSTGDLVIRNLADDEDIIFQSDDGSGGLSTYFFLDGSQTRTQFDKDIMLIGGANYIFVDNSAATMTFADGAFARFGTSGDLRISHDSNHSYISQEGTGSLFIRNTTDDADIIFQSDDGSGGLATYFQLDGSQASSNYYYTRFPDKSSIVFGDSNDLRVYHDSTDSSIENETGNLYIQQKADDKDIIFRCDDGSGSVTAYLTLDGSAVENVFSKDVRIIDNEKLMIGSGQDTYVYHNGSNTYFDNYTGDLYFRQEAADKDIIFQCDNGSGSIETYFFLDGSASSGNPYTIFPDNSHLGFGSGYGDLQLHHDGTDSYIKNRSTGRLIIQQDVDDNDIIFNCDDGSGGVTAYLTLDGSEGHTIANKEINFPDGVNATFGNATNGDLRIHHTSGESVIHNTVGHFYIGNLADDKDIIFQSDDGSGGLTDYIRLDGSVTNIKVYKDIVFADNVDAHFGTGGDLRIYHDGTDSRFQEFTGNLNIINYADDKDITLQSDDGSGGVETYLLIDGSANNTKAFKDIRFYDNVDAQFGNNGDLQIKHDSTNSYISNSNGNLFISNSADDSDIIFQSDDGSGGIETYFYLDGGQNSSSPYTVWPDHSHIAFGTSYDLDIYHTSTQSIIENWTGNFTIRNNANDADLILECDDGSGGVTPYLTLDGSAGYTVANKDIYLVDDVRLRAGTGGDFSFFHDGSNSKINNNTGNIRIENFQDDGDIQFFSDDGSGGTTEYFRLDGGLSTLEFAKGAVFNTGSYVKLWDSVTAFFGTGNDLRIWHNGSNSYISQEGTGDLYIRNLKDDKDIIFQSDDGSGGTAEYFRVDGSDTSVFFSKTLKVADSKYIGLGDSFDFHLQHNGTDSKIINSTGDLIIENGADDKDIIFRGDDQSGAITTYFRVDGSTGYVKFEDNRRIAVGSGEDLHMYHDGNNSYITQGGTGHLKIRQTTDDSDIIFECDDGSGGLTPYITLDGSDSITKFNKHVLFGDSTFIYIGDGYDFHLSHNGNSFMQNAVGDLTIRQNANDKDLILECDDGSGGVTPYITLDGSDTAIKIGKELQINGDNRKLTVGASGDLEIYHSGSHSYIRDVGTGSLYLQTNGSAIYLQDTDGNAMAQFTDGGGSFLMYNSHLKLSTTSSGVTVAGDLTLSGTAPTLKIQDSRNLNNPDWDNVSLGNIEFYTSDTTSPGARVLAEIEAFSNASAASGPNADLIFKTSEITDSSPQTRLTIGFNGVSTFTGNVTVGSNSLTAGSLDINGVADISGALTTHSTVNIGATQKLYLDGGSNTYITESSADRISFYRGGVHAAYIDSAGVTSSANVYTGTTGQFRNYAGTWKGTTGVSGNGFEFVSADATAMTLSSTGNMSVTGNVSHAGLTPTSGTDIDQIKEFAMSFTLSADTWTDTGIDGNDLATGTYMMQVFVDDHNAGGGHYDEYYSATVSWFSTATNSSVVDEIVMHRAGHAPNASHVQFRTQRHSSGGSDGFLMLQVKQNFAHSAALDGTNGKTMTFKFRRLI